MDFDNRSYIEKLINDENPLIEYQMQQTSKLKNIDLIEKNYEELYGWKSLFCKSRPISCYTQVKKNSERLNNLNNNKNIINNNNHEEQKNMSVTVTQNSQSQLNSQIENSSINEKENNLSELDEFNNNTNRDKLEIKTKKIRHPLRDNIPELNNYNNEFHKTFNTFNAKDNKEKIDKKNDFIFPVALIDEQEEKLFEYITIPKNVSDRRKKMENFLLLAAKALKKTNKKSINKGGTMKIKNRSNSMTNSMIDFHSKKNASMQATSSPTHLRKGNTLLKSRMSNRNINNVSAISQSLNLNKNEKNTAIRPMSVYAKRSDSAVYYMSKEFSDYFKQDLKEFCDKFDLLHPKIRCDNKKIKKLLEEIKKDQDEDEKLMRNFKIDDNEFNLKDLELAGNSRNILPLLKSFLKRYYNDDEVRKIFNDKIYPISNRPLTAKPKINDNKINLRGKIMSDLKETIERNEDRLKLEIEMYDKNDPDLKIFENDLEEQEVIEMPISIDKEYVQPLQQVIMEHSVEKENISNTNDILDLTKDKESFMKSNNFSEENKIEKNNNNFDTNKKLENEKQKETTNTNFMTGEFKERSIKGRPQTAMNRKILKNSKLIY